jgi:hypothetical protein
VRRRITDAWSRFGSLAPSAGLAAVRRVSGAFPRASGAFPAARSAYGEDGAAAPAAKQPTSNRNKALVAGAGVLAVVAIGSVIVAPRLLGGGGSSSDPGCKAYAGAALTAYNKTIDDLNAQAPQSVLSADMPTAITDLTSATGQAQSASVKSALSGLLAELEAVKSDVQAGSVPAASVNALNTASAKADSAC